MQSHSFAKRQGNQSLMSLLGPTRGQLMWNNPARQGLASPGPFFFFLNRESALLFKRNEKGF